MPEHVPSLLARMGVKRVEGLQRRTDGRAEAEIARNIRQSTMTWCGLDDDGVVTMGGVLPMSEGSGYMWQFVAGVEKNKRDYLLQGREVMRRALKDYNRLVTIIEADYRAALRHLRRNGWQIGEPRNIRGVMACQCERVSHV